MKKIEKTWFPELGEFSDWLRESRKEIGTKGQRILKEDFASTFTGGERVLFFVQNVEPRGTSMKMIIAGLLLAGCVAISGAYDTRENPDRYPSFGAQLFKSQVAGIPRAGVNGNTTDGQVIGFGVDYRMPVTNALTLSALAESSGIDNNKDYTDGYKIGVGLRVYIHD